MHQLFVSTGPIRGVGRGIAGLTWGVEQWPFDRARKAGEFRGCDSSCIRRQTKGEATTFSPTVKGYFSRAVMEEKWESLSLISRW